MTYWQKVARTFAGMSMHTITHALDAASAVAGRNSITIRCHSLGALTARAKVGKDVVACWTDTLGLSLQNAYVRVQSRVDAA